MQTGNVKLKPGIHADLWILIQDDEVFHGVGRTPVEAVANADPSIFRRCCRYSIERCTPGAAEVLYEIGGGISHRIHSGYIDEVGPAWYINEETE
jgi:hypothetical protein